MKKVLVILGHPRNDSLSHALGKAYAGGAAQNAEVRVLDLSQLEFALSYPTRTAYDNKVEGVLEGLHPEAWRNFFRQSFRGGAVGIWHETYVVERHEAVYSNMPLMGLARVSKAVPIRGKLETMPERLQKESV